MLRASAFVESVATEDPPIIDGHTLWHPWDRAVFLEGFLFLVVSYKHLPPRTSGGKFLCKGVYNGTTIDAQSWYVELVKEIGPGQG